MNCAVVHLPGERCTYAYTDPDPLGHAIGHAITFAVADAVDGAPLNTRRFMQALLTLPPDHDPGLMPRALRGTLLDVRGGKA